MLHRIHLSNCVRKPLVFTVISASACLYLITIYFNVIMEVCLSRKSPLPPPRLNASTKLILYWNGLFGDDSFSLGHGDICEKCPGATKGITYATSNRGIVDIELYDMILFHGNELSTYDLPERRNPGQKYVFVNLESPANRPISDPFFENFFNLTMTYRLDSDIPWPYDQIYDKKIGNMIAPFRNTSWKTFEDSTDSHIDSRTDELKWMGRKSKTAVWFVSNCRSLGGREKYVDELAQYMEIDIFGKCGSEIKCPTGQNCFQTVVEPDYFFYLSFENSLCLDYVTEKLFTALKYNVVPVVYGGANYSLFAPPHSYVNALDFDTPKDLANYLIKLTKDPHEYAKYFKWKEHYQFEKFNTHTVCRLCEILHSGTEKKTYDPLSAWYFSDKCSLQERLNHLTPYITKLSRQRKFN